MGDVLATGNEASYVPTNALTFKEFIDKNDNYAGYGAGYDFVNFWKGNNDKARDDYAAYLTNLQNQNEFKATQSARLWDKYLSDTQVQRAVEDIKKAGLNPWLAVQNGSVGSEVPSSSKASYKKGEVSNKESQPKKDVGKDLALVLLAVARLLA